MQSETGDPLPAATPKGSQRRRPAPLVWAGLALGIAALLIVLGMAAALGPGLIGFRILVVETPALEPAVPRGAVMVQEAVQPALLRPGDLISFTADRNPGVVFTHRVLGIRPEAAAVELRTQGPAGGEEELWLVPPGQPVGRLLYWIPLAGILATYLTMPIAWGALVMVGVVLLWLSLRPSRALSAR